MFQGVGEHDIETLRDIFSPIDYEKGAILFAAGEASQKVYIIVRGEVGILVQQGPKPVEIAILKAGDSVGEFAVTEQVVRSASAVAKDELNLLHTSKEKLLEVFSRHPQIGYVAYRNLLTVLVSRIIHTNEIFVQQALH